MAFQTVFKRYELKYMLTRQQKEKILLVMEPYMQLDKYGRTTIRNIYYDTEDYLLVRRSIEKPVYKEKLRIRSYSSVGADDGVFVELKKKYESVVYKRRISLPLSKAVSWIARETTCPQNSQISAEIDYFADHYKGIRPAVFLSYEREAFFAKDGTDFRVTFDDTILCRQEALSLSAPIYGERIIPEENVLMELKCSGGIPIWMVRALSEEKIYKTSFSKYGTAYQQLIFPQQKTNYKLKEKV